MSADPLRIPDDISRHPLREFGVARSCNQGSTVIPASGTLYHALNGGRSWPMTTTEWFILAAEYAEEARRLGPGRAGGARQVIARRHEVSDVTVARASTARGLAERLIAQGRLEREEQLHRVPVTFLAALARINRYRPDVVDDLLPAVVAGTLTGEQLRNREAATQAEYERASALGWPEAKRAHPRDGYTLRGRAKTFRDRALASLSIAGDALPTGRLVRTRPKLLPFPLDVNAVAIIPGAPRSFRGIRAYPTAAADSDRKRLSWALLAGGLGSRVFDEYVAVFEQEEDAWELSGMLAELGPMGFGVVFLDPADRLNVARTARRSAPPDLDGRFREALGLLFEPVET